MNKKDLATNLSNREWRLNNLYYITNKDGDKVKFKLNFVQKFLLEHMWLLCLILKSRQHGLTTFIQIYMLDVCLFNSNKSAGVIAHNREDAEDFFNKKIKFAYENLPAEIRKRITAKNDSARMLSFSNGSSIRVGTSLRSGTYQYLHISEFGKICARYPERAEEIVAGAINTVQAGNFIWIESTAEGAYGRFYEMCQEAKDLSQWTKLDFKLFFFPWFQDPTCVLDEHVDINEEDQAYFDRIERKGIELNQPQKNWYVKKKQVQKGKMKQEYPSTPEEAFQRISQHAVYGEEFKKIFEEQRICSLPYDSSKVVHTFWDLGRSKTDATCIWFMQQVGAEYRFIDYYQNTKKNVAHYVKVLQDKGYIYGSHYLPHDGNTNDFDLESYKDKLESRGIKSVQIVPRVEHLNIGIEDVREKLPFCWFDEEKCHDGLVALQAYQYEYDEKIAMIKTPLHNWASHPSDAFRQFAQGYNLNTSWSNYIKEDKSSTRRQRKKSPSFGKRPKVI